MRKVATTLVSGVLLGTSMLGVSASAHAEISANVALTSHYIFRGQDLTDGAPAIQGGFDYAFEKGLYLGVWASSAKTVHSVSGETETLESDYYIGYAHEFKDYGIAVDMGYIQYDYPHTASDDNELYFVASYQYEKYGEVSVSLWAELDTGTRTESGVEVAKTGNAGTYIYYGLGYELPLSNKFGLGFALGYQTFDDDTDEVTDFALSVNRPIAGLDFAVSYSDSDADIEKSDFFTLTVSKSY
ncbi:MAG: hypothetical protein JKY01_09150 [Pseudomonadales bacterium]|nr:hypothetical protein [Pseudomonadales bacterium]